MSSQDHQHRQIAIGDIHGRIDALDALLEKISPSENDLLVFLGDYIDRGPDSDKVMRRVMELDRSRGEKDIFIMGNHEEMMLRWAGRYGDGSYTGAWLRVGGYATLRSFGGSIPNDVMDWMLRRFVAKHKTGYGYFAHAGFFDGDDFYESTPDVETRWLRDNFILSKFKYPLPVCVGHSPPDRQPGNRDIHDSPVLDFDRNVLFLDCACYHTGKLVGYDVVEKKLYAVQV